MTKKFITQTLGMKNVLGPEVFNNPRDVIRIKELLYLSGDYPKHPSDAHPDADLYRGIQAFQLRNELKPDGVIEPGGPTDAKLAARSPTYRCAVCGAPHGGLYGAYCPPCGIKAGASPVY